MPPSEVARGGSRRGYTGGSRRSIHRGLKVTHKIITPILKLHTGYFFYIIQLATERPDLTSLCGSQNQLGEQVLYLLVSHVSSLTNNHGLSKFSRNG